MRRSPGESISFVGQLIGHIHADPQRDELITVHTDPLLRVVPDPFKGRKRWPGGQIRGPGVGPKRLDFPWKTGATSGHLGQLGGAASNLPRKGRRLEQEFTILLCFSDLRRCFGQVVPGRRSLLDHTHLSPYMKAHLFDSDISDGELNRRILFSQASEYGRWRPACIPLDGQRLPHGEKGETHETCSEIGTGRFDSPGGIL